MLYCGKNDLESAWGNTGKSFVGVEVNLYAWFCPELPNRPECSLSNVIWD